MHDGNVSADESMGTSELTTTFEVVHTRLTIRDWCEASVVRDYQDSRDIVASFLEVKSHRAPEDPR